MASYMSAVIDLLVTDVLEYLEGPGPSPLTASGSPPSDNTNRAPAHHIPQAYETHTKYTRDVLVSYWNFVGYTVVAVSAVILLLVMICRRCHRRKRGRVAFAGLPSHNQGLGFSGSCRRVHVAPGSLSHSKTKHADGNLAPKTVNNADSDSCETPKQHMAVTDHATSVLMNDNPLPRASKTEGDAVKLKEGIKRKLDEVVAASTTAGRKTSQSVWTSSQKVSKESPRRQQQHGYTYLSPNRKMAEGGKSANVNTTSYRSVDIRSRWKGSIPRSRFNKIRSRYTREAMQASVNRNAYQTKDCHTSKQRHAHHDLPATMYTSAISSPMARPVFANSTHSPQQVSRNYLSRSSSGKRKVLRRNRTLPVAPGDSGGVMTSKVESQKGKDNCRININWSTFPITKAAGKSTNEKSPKKVKRPSILLKGIRASGQKKFKKARKKYKAKERMKSMTSEIEKVTFPDKRIADNYWKFPEVCQGLHVPSVVRQTTTKGVKTDSFTIKRTATPVLSSLLGQGAFRTCWPQGVSKPGIHTQELDENGNTGRHNTNFVGPKMATCNSAIMKPSSVWNGSERLWTMSVSHEDDPIIPNKQTNSVINQITDCSQTKQNQMCKKYIQECNSQKGFEVTEDTTTETGFMLSERLDKRQNIGFPNPHVHLEERSVETQDCKNTATSMTCQNLWVADARMIRDCNQGSQQLCSTLHADKVKHRTEESSREQLLLTSGCLLDGRADNRSDHGKHNVQKPRLVFAGNGHTSSECERIWTSQCSHLSDNGHLRPLELWTQGEKTMQFGHQIKEDSTHREQLEKRYGVQDSQCLEQPPCHSAVTRPQGNRQEAADAGTTIGGKRRATSTKQSQPRLHIYNTEKCQAADGSQCTDCTNPVDLKEFRNIWKARIAQDGNVFRVTRNHMLPNRLTYKNYQHVQESRNLQTRHESIQNRRDLWPDSEEVTTIPTCRHSEESKVCHIRVTGLHTDDIHECSHLSESAQAQGRSNQPGQELQVKSGVRNYRGTACWEQSQAIGLAPRLGMSSQVRDSREELTHPPCAPDVEEWAGSGVRVQDQLTQSISSVPTTVDETSSVDSDSPTNRQLEDADELKHHRKVRCLHCFKQPVDRDVENNDRVCECRHHAVASPAGHEAPLMTHVTRHGSKSYQRQPSERPTGHASGYHGHVAKRTKSLISVRNMLHELTSHLRNNKERTHNVTSILVRKPRGQTLLYLKPARGECRNPSCNEEHITQKATRCPVLGCRNVSPESNTGTQKYFKSYRPRKCKSYRHEPYRKRLPGSSDSTATPSSRRHWTKNKNNCSPSRKGRYVLGPLVDRHVFVEEEHSSDVGTTEESGANHDTRRNDKKTSVCRAVADNRQQPDHVTRDNNSLHHVEAGTSAGGQETTEMQKTLPVFSKTRRLLTDSTNKNYTGCWGHLISRRVHTRQAPGRSAAMTRRDHEDSNTARPDTKRSGDADSGRRAAAVHAGSVETRYHVTRQFRLGYSEANPTTKRRGAMGCAAIEPSKARDFTKCITNKDQMTNRHTQPKSHSRESPHAEYTIGHYSRESPLAEYTIGHFIDQTTSSDLQTDGKVETNKTVEAANVESTVTPDARTRRHLLSQQVTSRHGSENEQYAIDTAKAALTSCTKQSLSKTDAGEDTETEHSSATYTANDHVLRQNENIDGKKLDENIVATDQNGKHAVVFKLGHNAKTVSTNNEAKNNTGLKACITEPNKFAVNSDLKTSGTNIAVNDQRNIDQSLFSSNINTALTNRAAPRVTPSRHQHHRLNAMKKQACLTRLKSSRVPVSFRYYSTVERNPKSQTEITSRTNRGLLLKTNKIPTTQSHTTQTENSINSAHVGVQTSPGLQGVLKKTTHLCKSRRYPKLLRDKMTQKELILPRQRFCRRPSVAASNSIPPRAAISEDPAELEHKLPRDTEVQNKENRDGGHVHQKVGLTTTNTNKQFEPSALHPAEHKVMVADEIHKHCLHNDHGCLPFENRSRLDKASTSRKLQSALWNENTDAQSQLETDREFPDKTDSDNNERKIPDSTRWGDTRKERTFILGLSNISSSGLQGHRNSDTNLLQKSYPENKQRSDTGNMSSQICNDVQQAEMEDEPKVSTTVATVCSGRHAASLQSNDSSALSSRLSELSKFCVIRPIWKNANIEEIDRRVRRALKLREELKRSGSSGNRARSLIASYFEASVAEHTGKSPEGTKSEASSTFASNYDSTNRSTYPASREQRTSFPDTASDRTLCQQGDRILLAEDRSLSSEDDLTKQDDTFSGSVLTKEGRACSSVRWAQRNIDFTDLAEQQAQEKVVSENEHAHGRHCQTEYTLSLRDETVGESVSRVNRPSSDRAPHLPNNSNSVNSVKRAAIKNKNSPPTKISKVDNICSMTPRLGDPLVQTLPQVPLSSFVEWFIETSDPNNFLSSGRPSSSSDISPVTLTRCVFEESTPGAEKVSSTMWQAVQRNKPRELEAADCQNMEVGLAQPSLHTKSNLQDESFSDHTGDHILLSDGTKLKRDADDRMQDLWQSQVPGSLSSAFLSTPSSATYGMSSLSVDTEEQSDLTRNSQRENKRQKPLLGVANETNYPLKPTASKTQCDNIMKGLCTKHVSERYNDNCLSFNNRNSKQRQSERSRMKQTRSPTSHEQTESDKDLTASDSFPDKNCHHRTGSGNMSNLLSNVSTSLSPQSSGSASFTQSKHLHMNKMEETAYLSASKYDKTGRFDSRVSSDQDASTGSNIIRKHQESPRTEPAVDCACPSEKSDVFYDRQLMKDLDTDGRCAPGIRHILMKLRQTTDVDEFPVSRTERTKITLRKCSDLTGIIAKFQKTQP